MCAPEFQTLLSFTTHWWWVAGMDELTSYPYRSYKERADPCVGPCDLIMEGTVQSCFRTTPSLFFPFKFAEAVIY